MKSKRMTLPDGFLSPDSRSRGGVPTMLIIKFPFARINVHHGRFGTTGIQNRKMQL